jgi:NADH-quinone oxidoreductase subunit N
MFVLVAVAFKLGVVPFHGWVADVYQGSPTSVTVFLASVPKLAAIGLFFRLFPEAFASHQAAWGPVLVWLAMLSIFIGNVIAIAQTNLKRLLGYSTIAHMGFIFLAFSLGTEVGQHAALFYGLTYALTTVAAFGLLLFMSRLGVDVDTLDDIRGLNKHHPWLSFMMLLVFLSMAGIPPLVGFDAKLFVLKALLDSHHVGLVVYALLMSVVAVGYYLRVIKVMFFEEPSLNAHVNEQNRSKLSILNPTGVLLSLNVLATLAIGIFPNGLYTLLIS